MDEYNYLIDYRSKFRIKLLADNIREFNNKIYAFKIDCEASLDPNIDYKQIYQNMLNKARQDIIVVLYQESILNHRSWGIYPSINHWTDLETYYGLLVFKDKLELYHRLHHRQCNIIIKFPKRVLFMQVYLNQRLICEYDSCIDFVCQKDESKETQVCFGIIKSDKVRSLLLNSGLQIIEYQTLMMMLEVFYAHPREIFYRRHEFSTTMIYGFSDTELFI